MARLPIDENAEESLQRIFEAAQGLQRRAYRIVTRGHTNAFAVDELRREAQGMAHEIEVLAEMVDGAG